MLELTEQGIAVPLGPISQLLDERLDLIACGLTQALNAAEISGVGLHQRSIKLVLANELAKPVANFGTTVVSVSGLWWPLVRFPSRLRLPESADFLDRADADPIGLAERSVHGPGFGHSQFGEDFFKALTAWNPTGMDELKMARMLVHKHKKYQTELPADLLLTVGEELTEDPQLIVQMLVKLIELQAEHLEDLLRHEESDRALRPESTESMARYFAAATRDLRRAVGWLLFLRAQRM